MLCSKKTTEKVEVKPVAQMSQGKFCEGRLFTNDVRGSRHRNIDSNIVSHILFRRHLIPYCAILTGESLVRQAHPGTARCLASPMLQPTHGEHAANLFMVHYLARVFSG